MEEGDFQRKIQGIRKLEIRIKVMLKEYNPDHVIYEDTESCKDKLTRIGEKYSMWRDKSLT